MKKTYLTLISIILVITVSVLFFVRKNNNNFELVRPRKGQIVEAIYGLGKVKSDQTFEVKVGVMTTVSEVYIKEGDFVKKGTPLVRFDGIGPFSAPFEGTITNLYYQKGEAILPQVPVLKMEKLSDLFIEVSLEQDGALRVKKGQKAQVIFESIRNEKHLGEVTALYPKNDEFIARIDVEGLQKNILTGMTADVAIEVGRRENALLIPAASIQNGRVLVQKSGKKKKVSISIGNMDGAWAEVTSGNIGLDDLIYVKR